MTSYAFADLITFTRASAATYVNSSGNIVNTPASVNLLTYTQEFDNAAWTKSNITVTANSDTGNDGTTTADTLTAGAANATALRSFTASAVAYTFSVYLKRKTGTGNIQITVDGTTYVTVAVTSTLTRFSTTLTPTAGTRTAGIRIVTSGDEVYAWGAQLEQAGSASTYTRNFGGLFPPRFDYDPITLQPKGFIMEAQRTNTFTSSENFSGTGWILQGATLTPAAGTAPDGNLTATAISAGTSSNRTVQADNSGITGNKVFSIFVKSGAGSTLTIQSVGSLSPASTATIDTNTGVITGYTGATSQQFSNGWWRIFLPINIITPTGNSAYFAINGPASSVLIWGCQLEAGTYASSYIPTAASQVTRAAEVAAIQSPNFAPWYNSAEGTFVIEYSLLSATYATTKHVLTFSDGTDSNRISVYNTATTATPFLLVADGGVTQASGANAAIGSNAVAKTGVGYKVNDFALITNGGTAATDTSGTVPAAVDRVYIAGSATGAQPINGHIRTVRYYASRLTNAELQALTV